MNRCFNDNEINILWDMFILDYPDASRSTKSQVVKKWKTGTYANTVNANAIALKYLNQLELKQKTESEWDKIDEGWRDLDEAHREYGKAEAKRVSEQEGLDRNKRSHEKTKESNDQMREIIKLMRTQLIEEMGDFQYYRWVDSHFNREYKSSFGL